MNHSWIDVTVPLKPGMHHWPGDAPYQPTRQMDMARGDVCNLTRLALSAHTGTHMDAPLHFVKDAPAIESLPLDAVIGHATVIEIHDPESIKPDELKQHPLTPGQRILFKTRNSTHAWSQPAFDENFVHISRHAARYLVEQKVRTVGVDYLSVGGYQRDGVQTHQVLLGAGMWLIEGLDLSAVQPGLYDMICLPLKLLGVEGAPARAVLRPVA